MKSNVTYPTLERNLSNLIFAKQIQREDEILRLLKNGFMLTPFAMELIQFYCPELIHEAYRAAICISKEAKELYIDNDPNMTFTPLWEHEAMRLIKKGDKPELLRLLKSGYLKLSPFVLATMQDFGHEKEISDACCAALSAYCSYSTDISPWLKAFNENPDETTRESHPLQDHILMDAVLNGERELFLRLIERGYELNEFIVNLCIDFGFEDLARDACGLAKNMTEEVFCWMDNPNKRIETEAHPLQAHVLMNMIEKGRTKKYRELVKLGYPKLKIRGKYMALLVSKS